MRGRPELLSPNLSLKAALDALCSDFGECSGLAVQAAIEAIALDDEREIALYRVPQESLTNFTRYARASRVDVRLCREDHADDGGSALLEVHDDGVGFDRRACRRAHSAWQACACGWKTAPAR